MDVKTVSFLSLSFSHFDTLTEINIAYNCFVLIIIIIIIIIMN